MNTANTNPEENSGYYLISQKWSVSQEVYMTFVRKGATAYCFNVNWAGPMTKFELERYNNKTRNSIAVHQSLIKPLLVQVNDNLCQGYALPNTEENRKIIGLVDLCLSQII